MEYRDNSNAGQFVAGLALGIVIGAGAALLSAPESGRRTRRKIRRIAGDVRDQAGGRWEEVSHDVRDRVERAVDGAKKRIRT